MLRSVSAAAARTALRRWMLLRRQISTVEKFSPFATPPTTHSQSNLFSSRAYPRMARRIPPARPDNYSDSEPDKEENEEEMDVSEEREDDPLDPEPWRNWGGMMFDFGVDEDSDPDPAENGEKDEKENK